MFWMEALSKRTDAVAALLHSVFWELCDPAPKDITWLTEQEDDLRALGVPLIEPCDPDPSDAVRLHQEVLKWPHGNFLMAGVGLVYACHLARACADPITYAVVHCAWAQAMSRPKKWMYTWSWQKELVLLLWTLFGRAWLRRPSHPSWANVFDIVDASGGYADFMTTKTWRGCEILDWHHPQLEY